MKSIMTTNAVAQAWGKQPYAATQSRNFRVSGTTVYSYSTPIGWLLAWGIVLNVTNYSPTTTSHAGKLWSRLPSLPRLPVFTVDDIPRGWMGDTTPEFVEDNYVRRIERYTSQLAKRKTGGALARRWLSSKGAVALELARTCAPIATPKLHAAKAKLLAEIARVGELVGSLPDDVVNELV